jgi:hypothetical protein
MTIQVDISDDFLNKIAMIYEFKYDMTIFPSNYIFDKIYGHHHPNKENPITYDVIFCFHDFILF